MEGIGHVGHQHGVNFAMLNINHAGQRVSECPQRLGFKAGQINQPHPLIAFRAFLEEGLAAINNHIMSAFHQPGGEFNEEGFSAAVSGRNAASAADGDAELAALRRI